MCAKFDFAHFAQFIYKKALRLWGHDDPTCTRLLGGGEFERKFQIESADFLSTPYDICH